MKRKNITNENLQELILELEKKSETKLFGRIAKDLNKPARGRREVNLSRLNRYTKEDEMIIVPGKVLGGGELDHKITISALKFSDGAISKLEKSGSKIIPINKIMDEKIQGKKIKIIG